MSTAGQLARRAQEKLDAVPRLASDIQNDELDIETLANRCDETARDLVGAASLLRRIAKQQKKTGAAGAVHDKQGKHHGSRK